MTTTSVAERSFASAFADAVLDRPKLPHSAVRLGLWLVGCAERQGGWPVVTTLHQIQNGAEFPDFSAPGIAFRHETMVQAIGALEDAGILSVEAVARNRPRKFSMNLD